MGYVKLERAVLRADLHVSRLRLIYFEPGNDVEVATCTIQSCRTLGQGKREGLRRNGEATRMPRK